MSDFLVEHANLKFPSPQPDEDQSAGTADISQIEVGLLEREWKANQSPLCETMPLFRNFAMILSRTSSERPFWQRMQKIISYRGFHLGYSSRLAGKTPIGERI